MEIADETGMTDGVGMSTLIGRLGERARDPRRATDEGRGVAAPPAKPAEADAAEAALGFALPSLLRRVLMEVGNGGVGPGNGLRGLPTGPGGTTASLTAEYAALRRGNASWPVGLVPLCAWGSGIESYADCSRPDAPVVRVDPNMPRADVAVRVPATRHYDRAAAVGRACWVESPSLEAWLEAWADGRPLFYLAYSGPEEDEEDDDEDDEDDGDDDDTV